MFQTHSHSLRHLATAHLAQTMTLLGLTAGELSQKIEAELASNPALELAPERRCPTCHRRLPSSGPCPVCSRPSEIAGEQPIVFLSPREDFHTYTGSAAGQGDGMADDDLAAAFEMLPAFVLRQIAAELAVEDRPLAAHILTSLDEDGLLPTPLVEIARYHHVPLSRVEKVIHLIQRCEPVGVGSASPQQALLVQLEVLAETRSVPSLASRAILEAMDLLSRRAYPELGRRLGVPASQAQRIAQFISENLNPFPARAYWGDTQSGAEPEQVYRDPDVIITRLSDSPTSPLVVEIVAPYAGRLRINPLFREALAQAPADKVEQWQSDLDQASLLVKCLQQRNHTIVRLMQRLAVLQREFILQGDAYLCPVTRASLALELDVHESTVSRAVSGKAVQLPNGRIVPVSKLFDRSLHIRTALREIIAGENRPLSDTRIASLLNKQGYPVARRTVAKYRAMEGILPARFRQAHV